MASGFYGADPDQLRALAKQFSTGSTQIRSSLETVSSLVNSGQNWQGPDASAFVQRWNSSVKSLGNTVVNALETKASTLIRNADEQTRASQADGGAGGPGSNGAPGASGTGGSNSTPFDPVGAFRDGWKDYGRLKAMLGLPKNLYGLDWMAQGGWKFFKNADEWGKLAARSAPYNLMDSATDLIGLKNLNKYIPALDSAKDFFGENKWLFKGQGNIMESLGKGGLGRGLGWLGVGLGAYDTVKYASEGKTGDAVWSGIKTGMGVACFLPPPVGTVFQVASAAVAIYEIPVVKEFVNGTVANVGKAFSTGFTAASDNFNRGNEIIANTVSNAIKDPGKFANDVGKGIEDLGKGAADFFGW
ncbi:WXG100 family type VII secretion target [Agreia sp. COWG]|uniref:WXG100 family type VII secretion target n=1 Tax=Agreia sp. COWG TaxID=2773266 RepID=UPI00192843CE|nr:WXG100 family type VII secretion target [Agreia sp. COWG]CAD6006653.1 conserved protein of unknown function [Agreia sp. COWG]